MDGLKHAVDASHQHWRGGPLNGNASAEEQVNPHVSRNLSWRLPAKPKSEAFAEKPLIAHGL
jgi:hypothetical protein